MPLITVTMNDEGVCLDSEALASDEDTVDCGCVADCPTAYILYPCAPFLDPASCADCDLIEERYWLCADSFLASQLRGGYILQVVVSAGPPEVVQCFYTDFVEVPIASIPVGVGELGDGQATALKGDCNDVQCEDKYCNCVCWDEDCGCCFGPLELKVGCGSNLTGVVSWTYSYSRTERLTSTRYEPPFGSGLPACLYVDCEEETDCVVIQEDVSIDGPVSIENCLISADTSVNRSVNRTCCTGSDSPFTSAGPTVFHRGCVDLAEVDTTVVNFTNGECVNKNVFRRDISSTCFATTITEHSEEWFYADSSISSGCGCQWKRTIDVVEQWELVISPLDERVKRRCQMCDELGVDTA